MADRRPLGPEDPAHVGDYRLTQVLGEGGQGIVYLGLAPDGRQVAIKVLHARRATDPAERRRFSRESAIMARLAAAFCTAAVLDLGEFAGRPYLISEYIPGPTLDELVIEHGPIRGGLDQLAVTMLTTLAAVHRAGIVHRDFKPSNVIMGPAGPTVIDFGIARLTDRSTTSSGLVGTPAYLAPEQLGGQPAGPPADVFAWAATMVYAATGHRAFPGGTQAAVLAAILTGAPDLTGVPDRLTALLAACFAKLPQDRPTTDVLLGHLTDGIPPAPPLTPVLSASAAAVVPEPASMPLPALVRRPDQLGTPNLNRAGTAPPLPLKAPAPDMPPPAQPRPGRMTRRRVLLGAGAAALTGTASLALPRWFSGPDVETTPPASSPPAATAPALGTLLHTLSGHKSRIFDVVLGELGGKTIAVSTDQETIRVWDLAAGTLLKKLPVPPSQDGLYTMLAIGRLGRTTVVVGCDHSVGRLAVWDLARGKLIKTSAGPERPVYGLAVGRFGRSTIAVSAVSGGTLRVWDLTADTLIKTLPGHEYQANAVALGHLGKIPIALSGSAGGRTGAGGGRDRGARLWDLRAGTELRVLAGDLPEIHEVAIGRLGDVPIGLATDIKGFVRVWNLATGSLLKRLRAETGMADNVAAGLLGDTAIAISDDRDQNMIVWDLEKGTELKKIAAVDVTSVKIGRLGDLPIAVSASSKAVQVWSLGSPWSSTSNSPTKPTS
ncbi:protein kinase [Nonomuraea sp. NN258]|uniref:WD40 repeat domain-containing serine/threonine protein kinase n=1 Tax=Nonomuraea antri TaxID=2730852 RepID=UPI001568970E|nr:serine/threonine-protein kinase [Nonomuraea antri]NRQ33897.1 protein kinase [Nonomuraea antri]